MLALIARRENAIDCGSIMLGWFMLDVEITVITVTPKARTSCGDQMLAQPSASIIHQKPRELAVSMHMKDSWARSKPVEQKSPKRRSKGEQVPRLDEKVCVDTARRRDRHLLHLVRV